MGWFSGPDKASLQGYKAVRIHGHRFVIRKVNPLIDFRDDNMPQIFTAYQSRRKAPEKPDAGDVRRARADMAAMIEAGLVEPAIVPEGKGELAGKEDGVTIRDIMRDEDTAAKLYWEILIHSLSRFRGIKGFFFSIRTRLALSTALRSGTADVPVSSPSVPEASA